MRAGATAFVVALIAAFSVVFAPPSGAVVACPLTPAAARDELRGNPVGDLDGDGGAEVALAYTHHPAACVDNSLVNQTTRQVEVVDGATGVTKFTVHRATAALALDMGSAGPGVLVYRTTGNTPSTVAAVDSTGAVRWERPGTYADILRGPAGQPDLVVIPPNGLASPVAIAVDAASGQPQYLSQRPTATVAPLTVDVSGDGRQDLVSHHAGEGGHVVVDVVDGASGALLWSHTSPSVCSFEYRGGFYDSAHLFPTDVTGDGRPEIALRSQYPCSGSTGASSLLDAVDGHERWSRSGLIFEAGDADADGRSEVMVTTQSGYPGPYVVNYALVDANGADVVTASATRSATVSQQTLGDADDDGAIDLFERDVSGSGGRVLSGRTLSLIGPDPNAAALFPAQSLGGSTDGVGDDTVREIVTADSVAVFDALTGSMRWVASLGFFPYPPSWTSVLFMPADATGDGRADVVLHAYRSQSSPFKTANGFAVFDGTSGALLWQRVALGY